MSSQHHRPRSHNGGVRYKQRSRQEYGVSCMKMTTNIWPFTASSNEKILQDSQQAPEQGLSNGIIILTFAIMIGCFAVLWPKIFSPMLFGEPLRQPKLDDEGKHFWLVSTINEVCLLLRNVHAGSTRKRILEQCEKRKIEAVWTPRSSWSRRQK